MSSELGSVALPPVSLQLLNALRQAFPEPVIEPGQDNDLAMYKAGQAYVVKWIEKKAGVTQAVTDPVAAQKAVVRLGS